MLEKCCILNYQSKVEIDCLNSYNFWFTGNLIRIVGDKKFGRGDIASIKSIEKINNYEWIIKVNVIGDSKLDKIPEEILELEEIPTLILLTTKVYFDIENNFKFTSDNAEILLECNSVMHNNKSFTIACLVKGKSAKINGYDEYTNNKIEWTITDGI